MNEISIEVADVAARSEGRRAWETQHGCHAVSSRTAQCSPARPPFNVGSFNDESRGCHVLRTGREERSGAPIEGFGV
jgi:hypothetical protein